MKAIFLKHKSLRKKSDLQSYYFCPNLNILLFMNPIKKIQLIFLVPFFVACNSETNKETAHGGEASANTVDSLEKTISNIEISKPSAESKLDTVEYNKRLVQLSNGDSTGRWPVKTKFPYPGAILPFNRIVAYYGNLYSKKMGILGELSENAMLDSLKAEVARWTKADTATPAIPALHYIVTTAQLDPGKNGKYMLRMPFGQVDKVIDMANRIEALVLLDIQVGHSNLQEEVPRLNEYLKKPNIHLGIDAEYSMKTGARPGSKIGYFDAEDINFTIQHLAKIVDEHHLPPKVLIVHRFTQGMVKDYKQIKTVPQVQVVMTMDGWGNKPKKINTYRQFIYPEPVQFTGFKLFYKNDTEKVGADRVMYPHEVLALKPKPIYIQYQ
jgi:hypothetical protein